MIGNSLFLSFAVIRQGGIQLSYSSYSYPLWGELGSDGCPQCILFDSCSSNIQDPFDLSSIPWCSNVICKWACERKPKA